MHQLSTRHEQPTAREEWSGATRTEQEYVTIYRGIGISITRYQAPNAQAAARRAMADYSMDCRDGDSVLVVELEHVSEYAVEQPAAQLGELRH